MRARAMTLAMAAVALAVSPGLAIPPPQPAFAAYGPLTQCLAGYRIAASEVEAVTNSGWIMLQADRFYLILDRVADLPPDRAAGARSADLDVSGLGRVRRFSLPARPNLSPAVGEIREASTEYLLPALGGEGPVLARSRNFDGSARDLSMLARIAPVDAARDQCSVFGPPHYRGQNPGAMYWSPVRHSGPSYLCLSGIGVAAGADTQVQRPWATSDSYRSWARFHAPAGMLALTAPGTPVRRIGRARGPVAAGCTLVVEDQGGGGLLSLRDPGAPADRPWLGQITVRYEPGQEAAARSFAERIEFAERNDRRCRGEG